MASASEETNPAAAGGSYEVLARRHRPQSFEDLVGQDAPARALKNAIRSNRVGHAYLFTGARGVGKTSTARIFSKALNCRSNPEHPGTPCQTCEACQDIANGRDIDVIEIDGASNRGIDEIRQLRATVNVRPSRSPFKIYIIDEVHMLTTPAFNALLKTLEEPPAHVKFIFCTTDPEKIPITVLSRCQRFDFATVETSNIAGKLRQIVDLDPEVEADEDALKLIARRARGSVRDSQSLLEQVLAFCEGRVTKSDVHSLLGTAHGGSMLELLRAIAETNPAKAISTLDQAIASGVDPGQLADQLLGFIRDTLAFAVGCGAEFGQHSDEADFQSLDEIGKQLGVNSLLAISQVIDQSLTRMRHSTQPRVILELALVRATQLGSLSQLPELLKQAASASANNTDKPSQTSPISGSKKTSNPSGNAAQSTNPATGSTNDTTASATSQAEVSSENIRPETDSKKNEKSSSPPLAASKQPSNDKPLSPESARKIWSQAVSLFEDTTADLVAGYREVATNGPNSLVVTLKSAYNKELCDRPERKSRIEAVVSDVARRRLVVSFMANVTEERRQRPAKGPSRASLHQLRRELEKHPLVAEAVEIFDAEVEDVQFGRKEQAKSD